MAMQFTGLQVVSWILLLVGTGMLAISLISDFWSIHEPRSPTDNLVMNRGILKQCISTRQYASCSFRLSSMFKQLRNYMESYDVLTERTTYQHLATQTFEVVVALFIVIAALIAGTILFFGPFCCQRCKASTTLLLFLTGVFAGSGCLIYLNANREGKTFTLQQMMNDVYQYDYGSRNNTLSWSFYLAVASSVTILFSALLLCVSSRVDPDVEFDNESTTV
ncbi:unnamed protein product [Caenorhabditis bovis]|uniref:Uncharacterized protein n=1 Tax=Caenorhabditis bovis TaxID=2654633 RepID=A0A8S1EKL1_9PELO|nr:unnamed protein product [Caenorhabditis bovis]